MIGFPAHRISRIKLFAIKALQTKKYLYYFLLNLDILVAEGKKC